MKYGATYGDDAPPTGTAVGIIGCDTDVCCGIIAGDIVGDGWGAMDAVGNNRGADGPAATGRTPETVGFGKPAGAATDGVGAVCFQARNCPYADGATASVRQAAAKKVRR